MSSLQYVGMGFAYITKSFADMNFLNESWRVILSLETPRNQSTLNYANSEFDITSETFGHLINISGRQRMLSQRIILNIFLSSHGHEQSLKIARDDLNLFKDSHQALVVGNNEMPGVFFESLKLAYYDELDGHKKNLEFIDLAEQTLSAYESNYRSAPSLLSELGLLAMPIVKLLNQITLVYESESKAFVKLEQRKHRYLMNDIQNIAKQAKIVAVNAQISAARAGEVGREFSVVATELTHITEKIDCLAKTALQDFS